MVHPGATMQEKPSNDVQLTVQVVQESPARRRMSCLRLTALLLGSALTLTTIVLLSVMLARYVTYWKRVADDISPTATPETIGMNAKQQEAFTFDDVFDTRYRPRYASFSWENGEDAVTYQNANGDVLKYDIETNQTVVIVDGDTMSSLGGASYSISADGRYLLIPYDVITEIQDIQGQSKYRVYDIEQEKQIDFPNSDSMRSTIIEYCGWTGDSHEITFVWRNNLYYIKAPEDEPIALTTNGEMNKIKNGNPFGYQGIIGNYPAHIFNPGRRYMAYGEYNYTTIKNFKFPWYGDYSNLYGETYSMAYPKGGDSGHFGSGKLYVIDMTDEGYSRVRIPEPTEFRGKDNYFFRMLWRDPLHLAVAWGNRQQTHAIVEICNVETLECVRNIEEQVSGGWLQGRGHLLRFLDDGESYLAVLPRASGDEGDFRQLAIVTSELEGGEATTTFLTEGTREITNMAAYNEDRHVVYFIGTDDVSYGRQLFRVGTPAASEADRERVCVSCSEFPDCGWAAASFSPTARYAVLTCQGPDVPVQVFVELGGERRVVIEDNSVLQQLLDEKLLPSIEFREIDIGGGYKGWAELTLPPGFVDDGSVKYPILMYPYNGPSSHNQATLAYKYSISTLTSWVTYLASSLDVITVRLDGRGTAGRGRRYLYELYKALGQKEIEDQILGGQYMKDNFDFMDAERLAIFGWSYGGFVTSHVIGNDSDVINCGVAVAPVTDFKLYYTGYTERYMSLNTPDDNALGFNLSSVIPKVENFRGKNYMLNHGSADDNVHFQQSAHLVKALTRADVPFTFMMYVDENHSILGPIKHLMRGITNFVMGECWDLGRPE